MPSATSPSIRTDGPQVERGRPRDATYLVASLSGCRRPRPARSASTPRRCRRSAAEEAGRTAAHRLAHHLAHQVVPVVDRPAAQGEAAAVVLAGPARRLHHAVQGQERGHQQVRVLRLVGREDLAQLRGERVRLAGLAVLAAEEAAVVAREGDRRRCPSRSATASPPRWAISPSDSAPTAMTIRVDAARSASKSGS